MDPPFGINLHDWDEPVTTEMVRAWMTSALSICTNSNVIIFVCCDLQLSWKLGSFFGTPVRTHCM